VKQSSGIYALTAVIAIIAARGEFKETSTNVPGIGIS